MRYGDTWPVTTGSGGPAVTLPAVRVSDTAGLDVHIGPHDIFRHDPNGDPVHLDTPDMDVHVDGIDKTHRGIAVLMWHAGTVCGATVYDRDDRIRRAG